ncbi:acyl-CoA thioesterase II [Myxococcus sp. MISCRS1]|uniref:acyl-CoA thioesterase II n=1 Tax=Myxococcus TaxID=32 RepID=UPI001CBE01F2|nr:MULTISPECIES: acyl-CoA thioesterase II [unclassified Myxococcus]MBZ4397383.1 acyl-CoA thioesterase II [Myxococcus sp. AS-1-15]MBZ4410646.1 acyl-CoA thioesterase II [Myxococcus sp. XM-1-1-1]MCY1003791.1 acyl-CoA thioesterase II [Myxococcus sp. MISCRS1]BDT34620.1 acyl-CoA thioesterase II [Myxococcus sp. MH1]
MSRVLDELLELLKLEVIEENLFRGKSQDLGFRQLFGGQVLGQALSAASQTVETARHVHSLHGYFLRPGDASQPVVYTVDRVRDGGSISTRRIVAIQKGQPIFTMMASFHGDEPGYAHQSPMPAVPPPEALPTDLELLKRQVDRIPARLREKILCDKPIEMRPVDYMDPFHPVPGEPRKAVWIRADGALPEDPQVHKYVLAYASDFNLISTALLPHAASFFQPHVIGASLDHALWFHGDLKVNDWLLYVMDSPWSGNARGLSRGSVYTREGRLVASVAQEGLLRILKGDKPTS